MAQSNDDLIVKVKADLRLLQAGLRQAVKDVDAAGKGMEKSLGPSMTRVQNAVALGAKAATAAALGLTSIAVSAAGALGVLLKSALDTADGLAKMSDKTGFSVEELQRLGYAAGQAGVEQGALDNAISRFTRTLGDALAGVPKAQDEFAALGFTMEELKSQSPEETFLQLIRKLEAMPDAAKRAGAGNGVFGKSITEISNLAAGGSGALDQLRTRADELGLVLSTDMVRAGDAAGDSIETLRRVVKVGLEKALLTAAPEIEKFINELLADPKGLQERVAHFIEAAKAIAEVAGAAARGVSYVVDFAKELGVVVAEIVHGSDTPFEDEIQKIGQALVAAKNEVQAINDLGFLGNKAALPEKEAEVRRLTERMHELTQAQQMYLQGAKEAGAKPPPPPTPPPTGGGGEDDYVDPAAKAAEEQAKRAQERREKEVQAELDKNQKIIEAARERFMTEAELEKARYEMTRASVAAISETEIGGAEAKNDLLQRLDMDHRARLQAIDDEMLQDQLDKDKAEAELYESRKQRLNDFAVSVADSIAAQRLAEQQAYDEKIKELDEFTEYELEAVGGRAKMREDIEKQHQENMRGIEEDALQSRLNFLAWVDNQKVRSSLDSFAQLIQIGGKNNKKLFQLSKALSLANAVATLPSAVIKSYEAAGGYPFGIPAALAMAAAGAAQIAAIKNANYGGGASSSVAGSAAAGGGVVGDTNARPAPQISLSLVGGNFSQDQVRGLITQINEALADGAEING